jgi:hypothetical protein
MSAGIVPVWPDVLETAFFISPPLVWRRLADADDPALPGLVRLGMHHEQDHDATDGSDRLPTIPVRVVVRPRRSKAVGFQNRNTVREGEARLLASFAGSQVQQGTGYDKTVITAT